ncbi:site-specific integrase [Roseovarius aestuariivivens]|uniref:site-specific integrase n=1 Tax=Roseovarius aestuariivivens TaxID=1888910 RepID=UPI001080F7F3|nr:tyrosine-type recombinase/integrase [Roseovarius aestuariivivens]
MRRPVRLKHLNRSGHWPSGNPRLYFRPKGKKGVPLPDLPADHPTFIAEYAKLYEAHEQRRMPPTVRHRTGTIGAACRHYLASDAYRGLAPTTRAVWRRQVEKIEALYGIAMLADLRPVHIRKDLANLEPHPANTRRKVWRSLGAYWLEFGFVEEDPTTGVKARKTPMTTGHKAWSRADFKTFREYWPIESPQRLAFELMYRTCASIGDACRMGPAMIKDGWLSYQRGKSGSVAVVPMTGGPLWYEPDDCLEQCLAVQERHMTFIVTSRGAARSGKAAAQWFSRACAKAGLTGLTAHGIRKGRAAVFKENGATKEQRMAILGHETEAQADNYSKSADLRRVITGTKVPTSKG